MPTMKEYRKMYMVDESYQEIMRTTSNKSVWNQILEVDPLWAEFLFTRSELPDAATAAEIRYLRWVKQSEFAKNYGFDYDYQEMEYLFNGFLPEWDFNWEWDIDLPVSPREGGGVWPPGDEGEDPWSFGCDANTDGCYCPGMTSSVTITGNLPIYGIGFVHGEGETVQGYEGLGTNSITVQIAAPADRSGQMRINVLMREPGTGRPCVSTINIYPCDEDDCCSCDDFEYDWDSSDETIGAVPGSATVAVTGGTPPYTWSVSGTGYSFAVTVTDGVSNTLDADVTACGTADITVTDSCDCEVEGSVRYTGSGSWSLVDNLCHFPGLPEDDPWTHLGSNIWQATTYRGGYRQRDRQFMYSGTSVGGSFANEEDCTEDRNNDIAGGCGGGGCGIGGCHAQCTSECINKNDPLRETNHCTCGVGSGDPYYRVNSTIYDTGCLDGCTAPYTWRHCGNCWCKNQWYFEKWIC